MLWLAMPRQTRRRWASLILVTAFILCAAGPVAATDGVHEVLGTKLPYWRVGDIDRKLSVLCSYGKFNQRIPYRFVGRFVGPKGTALVGGVKGNGLNLWDPTRQAKTTRDYWFHRDRTSACIVFSARVKPNSNPQLPAAPGDEDHTG